MQLAQFHYDCLRRGAARLSSASDRIARSTSRAERKIACTGAIWAAMLALTWPSPANANLFANGDFISNASGWTLSGGCFPAAFVAGVGNPSGSVLLNSCGEGSSDPFASQAVSGLAVGAAYRIEWDYALHIAVSGANGKSFGVFLDDAPLKLTETLSGAFVSDFVDFVATSPTHTIKFAGELDTRTLGVPNDTDVSYYLDNASLSTFDSNPPSAVSEPVTLTLLGVGMAAIAVLRRRRDARD